MPSGADIVYGTELGHGNRLSIPVAATSVDHILKTGLSDADRLAILAGNLVKLLGVTS